MPRVLIAGLGSIGRRHLKNLRELNVEDISLYRTKPLPLEDAPELPVFTDLKRALARRPDVVIISNPTAYHLGVALPSAQAGCNLFIEKPISHSWDNLEELFAIVRRQNLTTLVGFDLRFDPGLRKIKALIEESRIGQVTAIQCQVGQYLPDWHPNENYRFGVSARHDTGGGVILDLIHELDYVCWLMGPAARASCFARKISGLEIETEDHAVIILDFEFGAIGSIHLDYVQRVPSRTCRVIGDAGTILWDNFARTVRWYEAAQGVWQTFDYADFRRNDRFLAEMRHLLACLRGIEQPAVDVFKAGQVLRVALAAKESSLTGRVVRLSE